MAVAGIAAAHKNAIGTFQEGLDDVLGVHHATAHHPDDFYIRRIRETRGARQVCRRVSAPIAEEGDDGGFEIIVHGKSPFGQPGGCQRLATKLK